MIHLDVIEPEVPAEPTAWTQFLDFLVSAGWAALSVVGILIGAVIVVWILRFVIRRVVNRIEMGEGRQEDMDLLVSVADNIAGRTICALGDAAALPVKSFIKHFRDEFQHHVDHKRCLVAPYL